MRTSMKKWIKDGDPWIWFNAGAVAISMIMVFGLLFLIASRGLVHFWPHDVMETEYVSKSGDRLTIMGELVESEMVPAAQLMGAGYAVPEGAEFMQRNLLKPGNRDVTGADFRWVLDDSLENRRFPEQVIVMERRWESSSGGRPFRVRVRV